MSQIFYPGLQSSLEERSDASVIDALGSAKQWIPNDTGPGLQSVGSYTPDAIQKRKRQLFRFNAEIKTIKQGKYGTKRVLVIDEDKTVAFCNAHDIELNPPENSSRYSRGGIAIKAPHEKSTGKFLTYPRGIDGEWIYAQRDGAYSALQGQQDTGRPSPQSESYHEGTLLGPAPSPEEQQRLRTELTAAFEAGAHLKKPEPQKKPEKPGEEVKNSDNFWNYLVSKVWKKTDNHMLEAVTAIPESQAIALTAMAKKRPDALLLDIEFDSIDNPAVTKSGDKKPETYCLLRMSTVAPDVIGRHSTHELAIFRPGRGSEQKSGDKKDTHLRAILAYDGLSWNEDKGKITSSPLLMGAAETVADFIKANNVDSVRVLPKVLKLARCTRLEMDAERGRQFFEELNLKPVITIAPAAGLDSADNVGWLKQLRISTEDPEKKKHPEHKKRRGANSREYPEAIRGPYTRESILKALRENSWQNVENIMKTPSFPLEAIPALKDLFQQDGISVTPMTATKDNLDRDCQSLSMKIGDANRFCRYNRIDPIIKDGHSLSRADKREIRDMGNKMQEKDRMAWSAILDMEYAEEQKRGKSGSQSRD